MTMEDITEAEMNVLKETVTKLNAASDGVSYRLVEIKGTYYIYPQFSSVRCQD